MRTILVTGGAGFIGSCFVRMSLLNQWAQPIVLDKLTYAGNLDSLPAFGTDDFVFVQGDIVDRDLVRHLLREHQPVGVVNFAAESHVDRSIEGPMEFVHTNVVGTCELLEAAHEYWRSLDEVRRGQFRFLQISTDEVFGSLGATDRFHELTPYRPNSPYSASKAAADHFVRAYHETFGLPTLITNASNNYGPYQFPEKLVPLMILNAVEGKPLPVYGDGQHVRDWLFVEDHCRAIWTVLEKGNRGSVYNVGGGCEKPNIEMVQAICDLVDELSAPLPIGSRRELIEFVPDRPGHDRRYAMDITKITTELGWCPRVQFDLALRQTVQWYLENREWVSRVSSGEYRRRRGLPK